jgi:hypothetical protein
MFAKQVNDDLNSYVRRVSNIMKTIDETYGIEQKLIMQEVSFLFKKIVELTKEDENEQ